MDLNFNLSTQQEHENANIENINAFGGSLASEIKRIKKQKEMHKANNGIDNDSNNSRSETNETSIENDPIFDAVSKKLGLNESDVDYAKQGVRNDINSNSMENDHKRFDQCLNIDNRRRPTFSGKSSNSNRQQSTSEQGSARVYSNLMNFGNKYTMEFERDSDIESSDSEVEIVGGSNKPRVKKCDIPSVNTNSVDSNGMKIRPIGSGNRFPTSRINIHATNAFRKNTEGNGFGGLDAGTFQRSRNVTADRVRKEVFGRNAQAESNFRRSSIPDLREPSNTGAYSNGKYPADPSSSRIKIDAKFPSQPQSRPPPRLIPINRQTPFPRSAIPRMFPNINKVPLSRGEPIINNTSGPRVTTGRQAFPRFPGISRNPFPRPPIPQNVREQVSSRTRNPEFDTQNVRDRSNVEERQRQQREYLQKEQKERLKRQQGEENWEQRYQERENTFQQRRKGFPGSPASHFEGFFGDRKRFRADSTPSNHRPRSAPQFEPKPEPQYEPRPEPRPEPQYEPRNKPRYEPNIPTPIQTPKIIQTFENYDKKWIEIIENQSPNPITSSSNVPWPTPYGNPETMTLNSVKSFLPTSILKKERVKWHPDKAFQKLGLSREVIQRVKNTEDSETPSEEDKDIRLIIKYVTKAFQLVNQVWEQVRG